MESTTDFETPDLMEITGEWKINDELCEEYLQLFKSSDAYHRFIAVGLIFDKFEPGNGSFAYRDNIQEWLNTLPAETLEDMRRRAKRHLKELKTGFSRFQVAKLELWDLEVLQRMRSWFEYALVLLRICGLGSILVDEIRLFDADVRLILSGMDWPY